MRDFQLHFTAIRWEVQFIWWSHHLPIEPSHFSNTVFQCFKFNRLHLNFCYSPTNLAVKVFIFSSPFGFTSSLWACFPEPWLSWLHLIYQTQPLASSLALRLQSHLASQKTSPLSEKDGHNHAVCWKVPSPRISLIDVGLIPQRRCPFPATGCFLLTSQSS